jgi:hypothetical protein
MVVARHCGMGAGGGPPGVPKGRPGGSPGPVSAREIFEILAFGPPRYPLIPIMHGHDEWE